MANNNVNRIPYPRWGRNPVASDIAVRQPAVCFQFIPTAQKESPLDGTVQQTARVVRWVRGAGEARGWSAS